MADEFLTNPQLLQKVKEELQKVKDITKELNKEKQLAIELERRQRLGTNEYLKGQSKLSDLMDEILTKTKDYEFSLREIAEQERVLEGLSRARIELDEELVNARSAGNQALVDEILETQRKIDSITDSTKQKVEELKDSVKGVSKEVEAFKVGEKISDNLISSFNKKLGLKTNMPFSESLVGKVVAGDKASVTAGLKSLQTNIGTFLMNPMNTFGAIATGVASLFVGQMKEMAKQMDQVGASLAKITGRGRTYATSVRDSYNELRSFGTTTQSVGESLGSLYDEVLAFTDLNKSQQKELIKSTVQMKNFGITSAQSAQFIDESISSLGMSTAETIENVNKLTSSAIKLGLSPKGVVRGFNQARGTLAAYGTKAISVFQDILAASKETAIEAGKLIDTFSKFDTFETAAQAAGRLNAVLGGNLINATQLLLANEAERVELIQQGLRASGLQYELLGKFERKNIGEALGISDISTLNKLFIESNQQLSEREVALKTLRVSQEDLNKAQRAGATLAEKLSALWSAFGVAILPVVDGLNYIVDGILEANDATENLLLPAGGLAIGMLAALAAGMGPIGLGIGAIGASFIGLSLLFEEFKEEAQGIKNVLAGIFFFLNPMALAILPLVGAIQYLRDNFSSIKKTVMDELKPSLDELRETFANVSGSGDFDSILGSLKEVGGYIIRFGIPIFVHFAKMALSLVNIAARIGSAFFKYIQMPLALIRGDFDKFKELGISAVSDLGEAFLGLGGFLLRGLFGLPLEFNKAFLEPVKDSVFGFFDSMKQKFSELIDFFSIDANISAKSENSSVMDIALQSALMSSPLAPLITAKNTVNNVNKVVKGVDRAGSASSKDIQRFTREQKVKEIQMLERMSSNNSQSKTTERVEVVKSFSINLDGKQIKEVVVDRINEDARVR